MAPAMLCPAVCQAAEERETEPIIINEQCMLACCTSGNKEISIIHGADGLRGEQESAFSGQENWSGAPLLSRASMNLKKTKAAVLTDDEVDDADWTCQGCLVCCSCLLCCPTYSYSSFKPAAMHLNAALVIQAAHAVHASYAAMRNAEL